MENAENQRSYYAEIIEEHRKLLVKVRKAAEKMLDKIIEEEPGVEQAEKNPKEKDSAANTIIKLSNLILKLLPLEQEIAKINLENQGDNNDEDFDITDIEIMEAYVEQLKEKAKNCGIELSDNSEQEEDEEGEFS